MMACSPASRSFAWRLLLAAGCVQLAPSATARPEGARLERQGLRVAVQRVAEGNLPSRPPQGHEAEPGSSTNAPVRELAPGIFQVGGVRLNQAERSVSFPAAINLTSGLIEYLLVTSQGKVHESLLRTEISPYHLQVAMLLLGAKGAPRVALADEPRGGPIIGATLAGTAPKPLAGEPVRITVSWAAGLHSKRREFAQLVLDRKRHAPMADGPFTFNGSRVWNGLFIAQRDGSIISTITDPDAMFNNPRPGRNDDENWQIIPTELPPIGTPVEVTITLESPKDQKHENH